MLSIAVFALKFKMVTVSEKHQIQIHFFYFKKVLLPVDDSQVIVTRMWLDLL